MSTNGGMANNAQPTFEVELPGGGAMYLQSAEEVELWKRSHEHYVEDYHLTKTNDLVLIGGLLQQQILLFRAQRTLNGMIPEVDNAGVPTGRYKLVDMDDDTVGGASKRLNGALDQIQKLEKTLGIDKVSRESGGHYSLDNYLRTLKRAAHERGIHISKRIIGYETFVQEFSTRLRMLHNLDAEDRNYHGISEASVLQWAQDEIERLAELDKKFAREKGKLYVGQL